jgi:DNA polymerase-3 subunit epsilon
VIRGISSRPEDTLLSSRARDYLAAGPAEAVALIEHVCQLPGAPRVVAGHLAETLLAGRPEFTRDAVGRWCLRSAEPPGRELGAPATRRPRIIGVREGASGPYVADSMVAVAEQISVADELSSLSYVVVDVETTGGRALAGDRITEIAAVVVRDGVVREVFETLVNPERSIPPWITALTNISWDMVKDAPTFREVCDQVIDVLEGHIFVAHNATFDWRFVCAEVTRATGHRLDGNRLCTVRLARRLLPQLPRRTLDHVAAHYGVDIRARHRAAGDAVATAHVLLGLLRDARDRGVGRWHELERLLNARTGRARRRRRPPAMPHPVRRDTTA